MGDPPPPSVGLWVNWPPLWDLTAANSHGSSHSFRKPEKNWGGGAWWSQMKWSHSRHSHGWRVTLMPVNLFSSLALTERAVKGCLLFFQTEHLLLSTYRTTFFLKHRWHKASTHQKCPRPFGNTWTFIIPWSMLPLAPPMSTPWAQSPTHGCSGL